MEDADTPLPDPFFLQQFSCVAVQCAFISPDSRDGQPYIYSFIVPRQSYLPYYMDVLCEALGKVLTSSETLWYSFHSELTGQPCVPLPVQYPVSVLQDIIAAHTVSSGGPLGVLRVRIHVTEPTESELPRDLSVRFHAALKLSALAGYQPHRQALKQGVMFCYGTLEPLRLVERSSDALERGLFSAVRHNRPMSVWRARCALQRYGDAVGLFSRFGVMLHHAEGPVALIPLTNTSQKLGLFLRENYPPFAELPRDQCVSNVELTVIYIGGLQPLCSTPMDALVECLTSVDLFLHIVIKPEKAVKEFLQTVLSKREGSSENSRK